MSSTVASHLAVSLAATLFATTGCCPLGGSSSSTTATSSPTVTPTVPPPIVAPTPPPVAPPMPPPVPPPSAPLMPPTPTSIAVPGLAAPPPVAAGPGVIPTAEGLSRSSAGGIECRSGTHVLSAIVLDLQGDDVLWIGGDCNLTCSGCTLTGNDETIEVGGNARLTLVGSTVTARSGEALYVAGYAQATVTGSRLTGRPAGYVSGEATITTMGTVYAGRLQRGGLARIVNQGGNTGVP